MHRGMPVICLVFTLTLAACGSNGDSPAATASTTTVPVTTTISTTTSTTTGSTTAPMTTVATTTTTEGPKALTFKFGALEAGSYASDEFAFPFSLDLPEGLRGIVEDRDAVWLGRDPLPADEGLGFYQALTFLATRRTDPVAKVADSIAADRLTVLERVPAQLAGLTGERIDATIDGSWGLRSISPQERPEVYGTAGPGLERFYVLETGSGSVIIWIEAPEEVWDAFLADAESILATLSFNG